MNPQLDNYIRDTFTSVPAIVTHFEQRARALPIPPHHVTPEVGKLLQVLVQAVQAKSILEIGTMWGYSAWWLAQGLQPHGQIITLEKELKHYNLAKQFLAELQLTQVELKHCDALKVLPTCADNQFDFVFLDADKREYLLLLDEVERVLQPGGLFIVDNVLLSSGWNDKTVADETTDERIQIVQAFNKRLATSSHWSAVPLAIRSGIMVAVKQ